MKEREQLILPWGVITWFFLSVFTAAFYVHTIELHKIDVPAAVESMTPRAYTWYAGKPVWDGHRGVYVYTDPKYCGLFAQEFVCE